MPFLPQWHVRLLSSKQRILRPGGVRAGWLLFDFRTIRIIFIEFRRKENKFHQDSTPYIEQNGHALSMTVFPCEHSFVYPPRALRGDQLGEHFFVYLPRALRGNQLWESFFT